MIKIGHSKRLAKRMQVLRSSNPGGCQLLGVILGGASLETSVHKLFHDQRASGEWFADSPALRSYIASNCDPVEARRAIVREWAGVTRPQ
jgi:T5orf172 domain